MFKTLWARLGTSEAAPPWGILAGLSVVIASFAAVIAGVFIASALLNDRPYTTLAGWTIGALLTIIFLFVRFRRPEERAALWGAVRLPERARRPNQSTEPDIAPAQEFFLMMFIGVGLAVALDVLSGRVTSVFLPEPELLYLYQQNILYGQTITLPGWAFAFAFMALFQPFAEELTFRGVLLPALRGAAGAWVGYLLSALLYGVYHLLAYSTPSGDLNTLWYSFVLPLVAGLIFGAVRLYTGSTRAAVLAHAGFGLFAVIKLITLAG